MDPKQRINKSSWTLAESIKDAVVGNVASAARSGVISIEAKQLDKLLSLVAASVDEGYHRAHPSFSKTADKALTEASLDVTYDPDVKKK